jgi:hypothetical protein
MRITGGLSCLSVAPFLEWLKYIVRKSGSYFLARANAGERLSIRVLELKAQDRTVELIHFLKEVGRMLVKTYESWSFMNDPLEKLQLELKAQGRTNDWIDFLKEVGANASGFDCSRRLHRSRRVSLFRNHESKQYRQSGSPKPVGPCLVGP